MRLTELVTPLKPLEAMAMGVPVLASDVGGHAELIRHGETGLLFPAESPEAFVAAAVRLGGDGALGRHLGQGGRAFVTRERTWAALVSRYPELYAALRPAAKA
jgi:glycosyltransferase involved in cell wall biosynthesis